MSQIGTKREQQWPTLDAACADCRTLTRAGETCAGGKRHRVCVLHDPLQREVLMAEVWGPASVRRRAKELGKAGATGGGIGGFMEGCAGGCDAAVFEGGLGAILGAIVLLGIAFVIGYWLISAIARYIRKRRQILKPKGALKRGTGGGHATGMIGVVDAQSPSLHSPLGKQASVAYGIEFSCRQGWRRKGAMLREGRTRGFDLVLDSKARVRIPAGAIVLDMSDAPAVHASAAELDRYLLGIDPDRRKHDDLEPFPHDEIRELVIRAGDRLELRSPVQPAVDTRAAPTGYREPAGSLLEPKGIPRLRLLRQQA